MSDLETKHALEQDWQDAGRPDLENAFEIRIPAEVVNFPFRSAKRCLAELLQAYLAYPSIQNDMKDAAKECHQHMQSQPKDQRVKIHLVQNVLKYCATLLHYSTTLENWEDKVDPICYWLKNFHLPICLQLSGRILLHQLRKTEPDVASHLLTYSLEYKNLEWFSRAALIKACLEGFLPMCSLQCTSDAFSTSNAKAALSAVLSNTQALEFAVTELEPVKIFTYTVQELYFHLWTHTMQVHNESSRANLASGVLPLIDLARAAEVDIAMTITTEAWSQPLSKKWKDILRQKIFCSKQMLKQFASSMASEMPDKLLQYLDTSLPCKSLQQHVPQDQHYARLLRYVKIPEEVLPEDECSDSTLHEEASRAIGDTDLDATSMGLGPGEVPADLSNMMSQIQALDVSLPTSCALDVSVAAGAAVAKNLCCDTRNKLC